MISRFNRRQFLAAMAAGGAFFTERGAFAQALVLTPSTTEGPYYPDRLPLDQDNDLLVINDFITPALGTVAWVSGRVLDRNGGPIRSALVEIWGADNYGSYIHSNGVSGGRRDSNYQGYGRFLTASDGRYLFRTIKPGLYPGRTRHIHYKVTVPGGTGVTTQLMVEGEPQNNNDQVLNDVRDPVQRASIIRPWTAIPDSPVGALAATFDIVLGFTPSDTPTPTRPTLVSMAGVVNAATLHPGTPAGGRVTLLGNALSDTTRTWQPSDASGDRMPEALDGVSVLINKQPASVYFVSPTQINVVAPDAAADTNAEVTVTTSAGTSDPVTVSLKRLMPGFFQYADENIAAARADGALIGPAGLIDGVETVAARPGDELVLHGTGFGPTTPPALQVQIHTQQATVAFAGLVGPGLYQFRVIVPDLPDGDYPVTASVDGVRTAKFVKLRIQQS